VSIRAATALDANAFAHIIRESYRNLPATHVPAEMPLYHGDYHADFMEDPATRWAILTTPDGPAAVAMWRLIPGMAHLHMLFVAGEHQGKGFGVRLLKYHQAEAIREQKDIRLYTLHCLRESHWAIRFYKHHGYSIYEHGDEGRITDLYIWIDACRRHDNSWPLKDNKALFYKRAK
jgi:GNAT superfamily N-acetyltransferase